MVEVINRQKKKKIRIKKLKKKIGEILSLLNIPSQKISVVLCDNKFILALNRKFFKKNIPTDVIAFPLKDSFELDYLGEIIISIEEASLRHKEYGNTFEKELLLYSAHGILHLLGYRDDTKKQRERMERKQDEIICKLVEADSRGSKRPACELKFSASRREQGSQAGRINASV
jgi:probable rRNA maturation factor